VTVKNTSKIDDTKSRIVNNIYTTTQPTTAEN